MKRILAFSGSPRPQGNSTYLLQHFLEGAKNKTSKLEVIHPHELNLEHCHGCLRCNILRRCSISGDDWSELSEKILKSDILVFASPVYFRHVPAPLKNIIDRFRSFVNIQITETGLIHTPYEKWEKDFVLLLTMGSPDKSEAQPIIDLLRFMISILGENNRLHIVTAGRLALTKQIIRSHEELVNVYQKLKLPEHLACIDLKANIEALNKCTSLAEKLTAGKNFDG